MTYLSNEMVNNLCYIVNSNLIDRGVFMKETKNKKRKPFGFNSGSGFFKQMNEEKKEIMKVKRKKASAKRRANKGKTWSNVRATD